MQKLQTEQQFRDLAGKQQLTIAVFKTTWCPDCHFIDPFMPAVEEHFKGQVTFVEIDRDDMPELCSELNILGIPSFIAFYEGKELVRFVNKLRKSREEIEQFVDRAIQVQGALAGN
ncbi:thioredoxin family protein [Paenibacillus pinihumi]|uniref:thioredoxin family protein n=1 Tax=Paenibacillus pinihumi TaxID=669462 RepID=UPI00040E545F|nr:thioredoxin family protein [Paenibacillus pinihumi]